MLKQNLVTNVSFKISQVPEFSLIFSNQVGDNKPLPSSHVWFSSFSRNNHLFLQTF